MIKGLENWISREYGGSTLFEMEDAHALYFHNSKGNVETEFKVVKEDGVLWERKKGSEDWEFTFLATAKLCPSS